MPTIDSTARGFKSRAHHEKENVKAQRYLRGKMRGADANEKARLRSLISALETELKDLRS